MTSFRSTSLIVLTSFGLLFSCSQAPKVDAAAKPTKDRKPAPEFTLKDANGSSVKLSDYKGKVVLLNFWATWCGPCKMEIPWFIQFEQQYKDKGFAVLGVAMDEEGWEVIKPYLSARKINYRILLGNDSVTQLFGGVEALPTTFMIDKDGKIAAAHVGLVDRNEYANEIQNLLGTSSSDTTQRVSSGASLLASRAVSAK